MRGVLARVLLVSVTLALSSATARTAAEPLLLLRQGEHLRQEKEYSRAITALNAVSALNPQWAVPHTTLGEIYVAQGRWAEAQSEFALAGELDRSSTRALDGLAAVAYHRGHRHTAIELWQRALTLDHSDAEARHRLGHVYVELSDFAAARDQLQRLVLSESDHQGAHYLLDLALIHLRVAAAEADSLLASRAREMLGILAQTGNERDEARAAALLAQAFLRSEVPSLALVQLETVLDLQPDNHNARAYMGYALFALGHSDQARQVLREVSQVAPKNPLGYYFLGILHRSEGYLPAALWDFKRSLRLDPSNAAVYAETADVYRRTGQYVAAEEWYRAAVAVAPDEPGFRLLLAQFYVDVLPRAEKALAAASEAVVLLPDDPVALDVLGWARYLAGDLRGARATLERTLDLDPDFAGAYYHLGMVNKELGDGDTALWALQRAVDLDSEGFYRERATEALSG
jgi:tetratricopeptide (TPR) repeat protein